MAAHNRSNGFSLIEIMIVVAIVGLIALAAGPAFVSWSENSRTRAAVRSMADLLLMARSEAVRSSVDHLVFFETDAAAQPLTDPNGNVVLALLVRDGDGDGAPASTEYIASVSREAALDWGFSAATIAAPGDPDATMTRNRTFLEPDGATAASWVLFRPDGIPRAFKVGSFERGEVGSGSGAVYVTSGRRDYAVVLAPLGGVRVERWNGGNGQWQ